MIITHGNLEEEEEVVTSAKVVTSYLEEQRKTMKNTRIIGVLDNTLNKVTF
jgi:hypothetical protein